MSSYIYGIQTEVKHILCCLCLKSLEWSFEYVEEVTTEILRFLGLGLDLDISGKPVICTTCSDSLQKAFEFKTICVCAEDCINSFRDDGNNLNLDLWEIYLRKNENNDNAPSKCHTVCRLCMEIADTGSYISLSDEVKDVMSAKAILERYISEIDLDIIKNPVICISCNESLYGYFNFVKSLDMEDKVKKNYKIEESNDQPQEESKSVLQFAAENISNYKNDYGDIDISTKCDENELHAEIKLELGSSTQKEFQQLHIKHEVNEYEEIDDIKVEKLSDIVEKYHENEQNRNVKCKNDVINIKHEEIDIKTEEDDTARINDDSLKWYRTDHKNSKVVIYSCEICAYKTKRKCYLERHMLAHKNPPQVTMYSCEKCTYVTKRKYCYETHILIHRNPSEVSKYACEICTYKTKHKHHLKQHMLIHRNSSDVSLYSCEICTYKTKQKCYLRRHMFIHRNPSEVQMYSCEICTYKTIRKSCFKQHMLIHRNPSEVTMYSCEKCPFTAAQEKYITKHMLVHRNSSEVFMYSCEICAYKTKRKNNLEQHALIHRNSSEVLMYSCEICTYKTKHKNAVTTHMLIHKNSSEVTMYSCEKCTYVTKRKYCLKKHMLTHRTPIEVTT